MIAARQLEERELSVTMKEVEVAAITSAIYAAAGSTAGAKQAQKFRMMDRGPRERKVPTIRELSKVFPAGSGSFSMYSDAEIAEAVAKLKEREASRG